MCVYRRGAYSCCWIKSIFTIVIHSLTDLFDSSYTGGSKTLQDCIAPNLEIRKKPTNPRHVLWCRHLHPCIARCLSRIRICCRCRHFFGNDQCCFVLDQPRPILQTSSIVHQETNRQQKVQDHGFKREIPKKSKIHDLQCRANEISQQKFRLGDCHVRIPRSSPFGPRKDPPRSSSRPATWRHAGCYRHQH